MSPRSAEFMELARRRLAAARVVDSVDHSAAVSLGYYAMLYAARAALSERDLYAKTHSGTWSEFSRVFVAPESIDPKLGGLGASIQQQREQADYEAADFSAEDAESILADAERFVAGVEAMLDETAE